MKKVLHTLAILLTLLTLILYILYKQYHTSLLLTLTITFGTTAYHFDLRLAVGLVVSSIMKNKADYHKKWYHPLSFETGLYEILKVKKWKEKMPTYDSSTFSLKYHTLDEIAQSMCQSEIVHQFNALLSFVPLFLIPLFGQPIVFTITSIIAACLDMIFIIMQRYNRPRIIRLIERKESK